MRQAARVSRRAAYIVVGVLLLVAAAWDGPVKWLLRQLDMSDVEFKPEPAVRVVAVVLLVALVVFLRHRFRVHWRTTHLKDFGPGKPVPDLPEGIEARNSELLLSMKAASQSYSAASISVFRDMLADPNAHQVRITDEVEPVDGCLRVKVSTTFALLPAQLAAFTGDDKGAAVMLVPLIKATKGTMLDNVDTSDGAGNAVPFLSQRDARGLIGVVLAGLFEQAFMSEAGSLSTLQRDALWRLLRLVCQPGRITEGEVARHFKAILRDAGVPRGEEHVEKLRRFCSYFARNYVIVAEVPVPTGTKFVLHYGKTIQVHGRGNSSRLQWRALLGLRPYSYVVPTNLAFTAESYHFRMSAGESWYVRSHYLIDVSTGERVMQDELRSINGPVYLRVRHRKALPYAHLYTRGTGASDQKMDLATVVEFGQVPPGALGVTFALAASVAVLMVYLSLFVPTYDPGTVSGDILSLLFSVPPVAATFVGYSVETVRRSSLSTVLGLILVGVISFIAAVMYVQPVSPSLLLHSPVLFGMVWSGSVNILGLALGLIAVCNAFHLYLRLRDEIRYYLNLL